MTAAPFVDATDAVWLYRMEEARALPLVHLEASPLAAMLTEEQHKRFLSRMRCYYAHFSTLYRLYGAVLLSPRDVGYWLSVPAMFMAVPALSEMSSSGIMAILVRKYEFCFFTVVSTINWCCLASFFSDLRIVSLLGARVGHPRRRQLPLHHQQHPQRHSGGAYRHGARDIAFFRVVPVAKVKVTLVDTFVNTAVTLAIFIARKGYSKRKVLITRSAQLQTIRCDVFWSKRRLKRPLPNTARSVQELTETRTYVTPSARLSGSSGTMSTSWGSKRFGVMSARDVEPPPPSDQCPHHQGDRADTHQQVTLLTIRETVFRQLARLNATSTVCCRLRFPHPAPTAMGELAAARIALGYTTIYF